VNIYNSSQLLEVQSSEESILTEASYANQDYVEPDKKMTTHHRLSDSSKQNLDKLHEKVGVSQQLYTFIKKLMKSKYAC
jgi:hypothetical protein